MQGYNLDWPGAAVTRVGVLIETLLPRNWSITKCGVAQLLGLCYESSRLETAAVWIDPVLVVKPVQCSFQSKDQQID